MIITCAGKTFFAGADITEFGKPMREPGLPTLVDQIDPANSPTISIRDALNRAAAHAGADIVSIPAGTYTLKSGELVAPFEAARK